MTNFIGFVSPIERLGLRRYTLLFPFVTTLVLSILSEVFAKVIMNDPDIVGIYGIILFALLIVYFSFRDGIKGGFAATLVTLLYYLYIILDRDTAWEFKMEQFQITFLLGILYLFISLVIGWLKQTIDKLIQSEAEQRIRLEAILQQLPVGIAVTNAEGKILLRNQEMEKMVGRPMLPDPTAGRDTVEYAELNGRPVSASEWPIAETLATGKPVPGKNFVFRQVDGSQRYVQISASVIRNKENKVIAAATILNDVTHEKEIELRKDDFINMASHELKTPLTSLKLYIKTLQAKLKGQKDEQLGRVLERLDRQSHRLDELVNDLLDVSRFQTGKLALSKKTYDLTQSLKSTIDSLKAMIGQDIIFSEKGTFFVNADRFRIDQVVTNLITNAAKYSPGNSSIHISITEKDEQLIVSVQDFGIGISENQQQKIFDRLYQVPDSHEETFPGFGMGLFISKEIVLRHGGEIWVESVKGEGSTFSFSLPVAKQNDAGI